CSVTTALCSPSLHDALPTCNAGLYLLDGLRATEHTNAWVNDVNAARLYEPHNITLVMPVGVAASFYADWDGPAKYDLNDPVSYQDRKSTRLNSSHVSISYPD